MVKPKWSWKVIRSTYEMDFSIKSIQDAEEEIKSRSKLHMEYATEINESIKIFDDYKQNLPSDIQVTITNLINNYNVLLEERYNNGRTQMYHYIAKELNRLNITQKDLFFFSENIDSIKKFRNRNELYNDIMWEALAIRGNYFQQNQGKELSERKSIEAAMKNKGITDEEEIIKAQKAINKYLNDHRKKDRKKKISTRV